MSQLPVTLELPEKALQLLSAVGCDSLATLAAYDEKKLHQAVALANESSHIFKKNPTLATVAKWIKLAREAPQEEVLEEQPEDQPEEQVFQEEVVEDATEEQQEAAIEEEANAQEEWVNFEHDPDVVEMIAFAPLALPFPGKQLAAKRVSVYDIPEAVLLTAARGDVSIRLGVSTPEKPVERVASASSLSNHGYVNTISFSQKKDDVKLGKLRSTDEFLNPNVKAQPDEPRNRAEDRMRLLRSALPETNHGINPESRRYVRGVLHTHPYQVWWGALITIVCLFSIPTGIMGALLLLLQDQKWPAFQWVPSWFLVFPLGVFVFGLLYLTVSYSASCRICGQKCFVPRKCLKNRKAHHIPLLGYIFSVALHILLFRWFRCTYCGTPVRLKQ